MREVLLALVLLGSTPTRFPTPPLAKQGPENPWKEYISTSYSHGCVLPTSGKEHGRKDRTASGKVAKANWTVAASEEFPFGTILQVSYRGKIFRWEVQDRGYAIKDGMVDFFVESCKKAKLYGRRKVWLREELPALGTMGTAGGTK